MVDDLHRLERQRAQAQDASQRPQLASDNIVAMLQYYSVELEELGYIIQDEL